MGVTHRGLAEDGPLHGETIVHDRPTFPALRNLVHVGDYTWDGQGFWTYRELDNLPGGSAAPEEE